MYIVAKQYLVKRVSYLKMITGKKTKIVATIGPATESEEKMSALVKAGMNVARLNFSHGSFEEHGKRVGIARKVAANLGVPVAVLQDLCGPKIRIGDFSTESVELTAGSMIVLTPEKISGTLQKVSINYAKLSQEVKPGQKIYLDDGKLLLEVQSIQGNDLHCQIIIGGVIKGRRGMNIPGANLSISSLTEKDRKDAQFGIEQDVDFMALSFVRRAEDIKELREIINRSGKSIKIIAKIETTEAIANLESIIQETDVVMVARGDLAIEVSPEEVPVLQKKIISRCNFLGKPVITATQMLASMTLNATPTRAEVNDIANAILDGTDAIMLSEETTVGKHPEEAVKTMTKVALHTEKHFPYESVLNQGHFSEKDVTSAFNFAVANLAHDLDASSIVTLSYSGFTPRMLSRYKPNRPIYVLTYNKKTYNQMALSFNCYPLLVHPYNNLQISIEETKDLAIKNKLAKKGDLVIFVSGLPFSESEGNNLFLVQKI